MEWGAFGGPAAREAALWVQLQREFQRRNLLSQVAAKRLETLGFEWEPKVRTLENIPRVVVRVRPRISHTCHNDSFHTCGRAGLPYRLRRDKGCRHKAVSRACTSAALV